MDTNNSKNLNKKNNLLVITRNIIEKKDLNNSVTPLKSNFGLENNISPNLTLSNINKDDTEASKDNNIISLNERLKMKIMLMQLTQIIRLIMEKTISL